ncbi:HAD family hydrolase [Rhodohalobacter sp. WB101]|uniref:HAD family hydrolase n=1 Tax=Rhodohalobacter sulfatireducens TaxID=2911366 RepID=A0ABS9KIW4_9BACT|nr:HAD family hydrolase [Rhodohalobacter sulfatireducens]
MNRFEMSRYQRKRLKNLQIDFYEIMMDNMEYEELLIHETVDFIKKHLKKYDMYIFSGSDQTELRMLFSGLGIDAYFISINGSPTPRKELVKYLSKHHNYDNDKVILIGDSINDYDSVKENDISFFGYNNREIEKLTDENLVENFPDVNVLSRK